MCRSYNAAVYSLLEGVDEARFEKAFGQPVSEAGSLIEAKTVSIAKLMEISDPGTVDPTPMIYDSSMYAMAGMLSVALVCNALVRPVPIERQVDHLRGG